MTALRGGRKAGFHCIPSILKWRDERFIFKRALVILAQTATNPLLFSDDTCARVLNSDYTTDEATKLMFIEDALVSPLMQMYPKNASDRPKMT